MALTQVQGGMILPSTTLTTPIVATTMGVGGATPSTSGSGITFPATTSNSTNVNTLDDYEEGNWTPTILFNGTYSSGQTGTFYGFYTKIGQMVYATALINMTNKGSGSGQWSIGGLPFAASSDSLYRAISSPLYWDSLASSYVYILGLIGPSNAQMEMLGTTAATTSLVNINQTVLNNSSAFRISVTYQV